MVPRRRARLGATRAPGRACTLAIPGPVRTTTPDRQRTSMTGSRAGLEEGQMDGLSHDILIVGGGGAGLRAAIAIGEEDPRLSVGVISKVYPMRSHTVSAEGGAAAVIKSNDSLEAHIKDTVTGSDWQGDQAAIE